MRSQTLQEFFFEKYGLMVDCSKLTEKQVSRVLDIYPRPNLSSKKTLGEFFGAAFGDGVQLPIAAPDYQILPAKTTVKSVKIPNLYQAMVKDLRASWYKCEAVLKAEKDQGKAALESLKAAHQLELKKAEDAAYAKGLLDADRVFQRKLLVEANAALEEVTEQSDSYTNGIREDLEECIKNLESSPTDGSVGAYNLIIELSKKFAKRMKRSHHFKSTT